MLHADAAACPLHDAAAGGLVCARYDCGTGCIACDFYGPLACDVAGFWRFTDPYVERDQSLSGDSSSGPRWTGGDPTVEIDVVCACGGNSTVAATLRGGAELALTSNASPQAHSAPRKNLAGLGRSVGLVPLLVFKTSRSSNLEDW